MSDGNIISARSNWLDSLILSFRIVFSRWPYLSIAALTAAIFWTVFSIFDQLLFFSPIVIFYLPADAVIGFRLAKLINSVSKFRLTIVMVTHYQELADKTEKIIYIEDGSNKREVLH